MGTAKDKDGNRLALSNSALHYLIKAVPEASESSIQIEDVNKALVQECDPADTGVSQMAQWCPKVHHKYCADDKHWHMKSWLTNTVDPDCSKTPAFVTGWAPTLPLTAAGVLWRPKANEIQFNVAALFSQGCAGGNKRKRFMQDEGFIDKWITAIRLSGFKTYTHGETTGYLQRYRDSLPKKPLLMYLMTRTDGSARYFLRAERPSVIPGLSFHVFNRSSFQLVQEEANLKCVSHVTWGMTVCKTCSCATMGDIDIQHDLVTSDTKCVDWFGKADQLVRTYSALVRASFLAKTISCCSEWKPQASAGKDGSAENDVVNAPVICGGKKFDESDANNDTPAAPSTIPVATLPNGYRDITAVRLKDVKASCKQHAYFKGNDYQERFLNQYKNEPGRNVTSIWKQSTMETISCIDEHYPPGASAFPATMGIRFFPPAVTNHIAESHTLKLSCGGPKLDLVMYHSYYGHFNPTRIATLPTLSRDGKDVTGTTGWMRADGGRWSIFDDLERRSKDYRGYRPTHEGSSSTCCPPQGVLVDSIRMGPDHRPKNPGGKSPGTTYHDDKACFRNLFGETTKCESTFTVQMLECIKCDCRGPDGQIELVTVKSDHRITDSSGAGCGPWFTLADAGIRAWTAQARGEVMKAKAVACSAASVSTAGGIQK